MARTVVDEFVAEFSGDTRKLEAATKRGQNAIQAFSSRIERSFKSLKIGFDDLAKGFAAFYAGKQIINMADEFVLLRARIENATRSQDEFNEAFLGIKQIARETGAEMSAAVDVFQRISFVRDEINATTSDMLTFTDTVSKLGVISGASTGALKAGLTQLGQSLSSGIVRAEEFNSIMENIPKVGISIAEEFGVTTGQLRQLVVEGEVLSNDVFAAILNQSEKVRAEFEQYPQTVGRAFQNLKIRLMEAVDGINESSNATKILIGTIEVAGKAINALADLIAGYAEIFKSMFTIVTASITGAIVEAGKLLENFINTAIAAINTLRKEGEKIEFVDFVPDVSSAEIMKEAMMDARQSVNDAGKDFQSAYENFGSIFGLANQRIERQTELTDGLKEKYQDLAKQLKGNDEENKKAMKEADELLQRQIKRTDEYGEALRKIKEQTIENRNEMSDYLFEAAKGFDNLRDVAVRALEEIAKNIFRVGVMGGTQDNGILGSIGGAIGSIFSSAGSFVRSSGTANFSSRSSLALSAAAATGSFGPGFATGGSVMEDRSTGGPDNQFVALRKSRNERLTISRPGQKMGGDSQPVVINNSYSFTTGIQNTVRAEILQLMPAISRQVQADVITSIKRGGSMAKATGVQANG